jgi:hypothetical protein
LITLRLVLVIACVVIINSLVPLNYAHYVLGTELVVFGIFIIYKCEWTTEFIRVNLLSYPFVRYFFDEN